METTKPALSRQFICGVDIGGTFTDAVLVAGDTVTTGKSETNRADLPGSVVASIASAAGRQGLSVEHAIAQLGELVIGSTIGTNFLVENDVQRLGLITTTGFEDTVQIMRGGMGRTAGKTAEELADPHALHKPFPRLLDRRDVVGVSERIIKTGQELVALDEAGVREAGRYFREQGITSIAISFLWSIRNPSHEHRARAIVLEECPGAFVCCSCDMSGRTGEYERTVGAVLNALLGPPNASVTADLAGHLAARGYGGEPMFLNCSGGVLAQPDALTSPLLLVDSGPAGGVAASVDLAELAGDADAILCDMGGTTFDVGILWRSAPLLLTEHTVGGYRVFLPRVDITSIGAGGGSVAWADQVGKPRLRVGPQSAGAFPGPVAYARGGERPTVTDANLLLGYVDPVDYFGAGSGCLDLDAARAALGKLGAHFDLEPVDIAAAIVRIVDQQSADLVRQITIKRGIDLASCALYVYGGSGPLHAGGLASALNAPTVVMPTGALPAVWSAFGAATADMIRILEEPVQLRSPWNLETLNAAMSRLRLRAAQVYGQAIGEVRTEIDAMLGYVGQVHSIELRLDSDVVSDGFDTAAAERLTTKFFDWYDERYGHGFSYRTRAVEIRDLRCRAVKARRRLATDLVLSGEGDAQPVREREAWWPEFGQYVATPVLNLQQATRAGRVNGPSIVALERSAVLVHPGQWLDASHSGFLALHLDAVENIGPANPAPS